MATAGKDLSAYDKEALPPAKNFRFGIAVSQWNSEITEGLFKGAHQALIDNDVKVKNITRIDVPGSFELVYAASMMQQSGKFDAIIVLGSIIQGETRHFDFVCQGVTQGIKDLNLRGEAPVIFGVLTDNTWQQGIDRSGGKHGNKGIECAIVAIKMADLFNRFRFA